MSEKEEKSVGLKDNSKDYTRKIFDSPSSKSRILTPVKNALHNSKGRTNQFLKMMQNIVSKRDKENVNGEAVFEENLDFPSEIDVEYPTEFGVEEKEI